MRLYIQLCLSVTVALLGHGTILTFQKVLPALEIWLDYNGIIRARRWKARPPLAYVAVVQSKNDASRTDVAIVRECRIRIRVCHKLLLADSNTNTNNKEAE